jgi:HK97 family phage prohead protease
MPYFIEKDNEACKSGWAVTGPTGTVHGCHTTKASAIKQAVAISISTDEPFAGERAAVGELNVGDYVTWNEEDPAAIGEIEIVVNTLAAMRVYEEEDGIYKPTENLVMVNILKLKRIPRPEMVAEKISDEVAEPQEPADMADELIMDDRAVDLTPPAFMRAAARRGLALYEEGKGGDGLVDATIREARAMVAGNVTADKWVRIAAWIARHMPDLDAPKNSDSSDPEYPGPGLVAHLLWGSGPSKRRAQRAMAYAERIVARLEAESERGSNLTKEQRINTANFEVRQSGDGMTFSGYAAVWNSPSEPLPFIERIQSGAFRKTLQSRNEIKLLWNHDSSQILGSLRAGTLRLTEDAYGLKVEADLPDTQLGRDTATLLRRGDVNAMSFGFSVPKGGDSWNADGTERTLKSVRLFEVSIVGSPAYSATAGTATVRSFDKLALRSQVDEDTLSDVMLKLEEGQDLTPEEAAIISEAVNALTPKVEEPVVEPEATVEELEANLLELKRKQLELIKKKVL